MMYYIFECEEHGKFEAQRPMCDCVRSEPCPVCGCPCSRRFTPLHHRWSNENWQWGEDGMGEDLVLSHRV
jgi:hypothetical protein